MTIILGLDMSSTTIGYALADGTRYGYVPLQGDIAQRCEAARFQVTILLNELKPTLVIIESPVARYAKALIPQARVSGAVLAEFARRRTLWTEVPPSVAKKALTGYGNASKTLMIATAIERLGDRGISEHAADAYGLALAGLDIQIITETTP
jgi:Holliday junction resolvasome RuvABC endonuclease subunit